MPLWLTTHGVSLFLMGIDVERKKAVDSRREAIYGMFGLSAAYHEDPLIHTIEADIPDRGTNFHKSRRAALRAVHGRPPRNMFGRMKPNPLESSGNTTVGVLTRIGYPGNRLSGSTGVLSESLEFEKFPRKVLYEDGVRGSSRKLRGARKSNSM